MAFQVGRITGLNEPRDWDSTTNQITVTGSYKATSVADGLQRRDQFLGYANQADGDEPAIPIIIDGESRVSGYYRVLGVQVLTDEFTRKQGNIYDYRLDLEPVFGFADPKFEAIITGGLASNAIGAVVGDLYIFYAFPGNTGSGGGVTEYWKSGYTPIWARVSADGQMTLHHGGTASDIANFGCPPSFFYQGAARFEQGTNLLPVVGRQVIQNDVVNWRLSNGLVRVTPNTGSLAVSHYTGTVWTTARSFSLIGTLGIPQLQNFRTIAVLRNSPEEVIIRLGCQPAYGSGVPGRQLLDVALRRGERIVRCYLTSDVSDAWRVFGPVAAATAINYGAVTTGNIRANANDADGIRPILMSVGAAVTNDLANGRLTLNATATTMDFGISAEVAGGAGIDPDDPVSIVKQYIYAFSEKMQVVAR